MLVVNLETTPTDGKKLADSADANTVNDAKKGKAKSIVPQTRANESASEPALVPESLVQERIEPDATEVSESVNRPSSSNAVSANETIENQDPQRYPEPDNPESTPESEYRRGIASNLPPKNQAMMHADESEIVTAENEATIATAEPTSVVVTKAQQKMLNKKIKQWTENFDRLYEESDSINWEHKGQSYVANFNRLPAMGDMDMDEIVVEVTTEQNGQKLSKEMRMKKLAFSNFAQFTHFWDADILMHNDEMDGRFHSNSTIYVDADREASPVFHGKVTTASYRVDMENASGYGARKQIFRGGLETRVKKISMPKPRLLFDDPASMDQKNTILIEQDARIEFNADGHISWHFIAEKSSADSDAEISTAAEVNTVFKRKTNAGPIYIFGAPDATLYISGTVNGKVLVYSPKNIQIENDIFYSNYSKDGDFLGLVSGRDINIAKPDITGPGDLEINASIYAKGRFRVKNYTSKHSGTLRIFGSLSAGSVSATEPRYATSIVFDQRLEDVRPPGFPLTDRYEVAIAESGWIAEEPDTITGEYNSIENEPLLR